MDIDENSLPFPGDEPLNIVWKKTLDRDGYNLSNVSLNMHLGTHIDFKKHVMDDHGKDSFNYYMGQANVIFLQVKNGVIKTNDIRHAYQYIEKKEKVLFIETGHGSKMNTEAYYHYPKFQESIYQFLMDNQIDILGADLPSYEYIKGDMLKMHQDLLGNHIYLIENLRALNHLSSHIELMVLPVPIKGLEAAMVNVYAKKM